MEKGSEEFGQMNEKRESWKYGTNVWAKKNPKYYGI